MLQYYTLMRTKNKMKNSNVESKEWWEVIEEYFTKELEKNLAQHRADERILRYKLEVYQKYFLDFICGNLTNIKVSSHDEETEAKITQEEEVQIEELKDLRSGAAQEEEVQLEIPHDLKGRGQEEKKPKGIHEQEKVEAIPTP